MILNENRKIICSRDVIFNERVLYKDRGNTYTKNLEKNGLVYVKVNDVPKTPIIDPPQLDESVENNNDQHLNTFVPSTPTLDVRKSPRPHTSNKKYLNYILLIDKREPGNCEDACQTSNANKWEVIMKNEMKYLVFNHTWELVKFPIGKKASHNKWMYIVKEDHYGSKRYKTQLVYKGFPQKEGIDYIKIFVIAVKLNNIGTVLSIVVCEGLYLEQLDVNIAFLHGDLDEEIYMY